MNFCIYYAFIEREREMEGEEERGGRATWIVEYLLPLA